LNLVVYIIMGLHDYLMLKKKGFIEGHTQQIEEQVKDLALLVSDKNIKKVMEIGFNAGHSAEIFLRSNLEIDLVSFDIGNWEYMKFGKEYIDSNFYNRHMLILGDSNKSIPTFTKLNNIKFDLIFIDGGHEYSVAKNDLLNCRKLAHENTIVILDDTVISEPEKNPFWVRGPTFVWKELCKNGFIKELGTKEYAHGRGMSWGKYVF